MGRRTFSSFARRQVYWSWRKHRAKRQHAARIFRGLDPWAALANAAIKLGMLYAALALIASLLFILDLLVAAVILVTLMIFPPIWMLYSAHKQRLKEKAALHLAELAAVHASEAAYLRLLPIRTRHLGRIFDNVTDEDTAQVMQLLASHKVRFTNGERFLLSLTVEQYSWVCKLLAGRGIFRRWERHEFRTPLDISISDLNTDAGSALRNTASNHLQNYLLGVFPLINAREQDAAWTLLGGRNAFPDEESLEAALFEFRHSVASAQLGSKK